MWGIICKKCGKYQPTGGGNRMYCGSATGAERSGCAHEMHLKKRRAYMLKKKQLAAKK